MDHSYQQARVFHDNGTWSDVNTVHFSGNALRFIDIVLDDYEMRLRDIAHLRYGKAIARGEMNPVIVVWACLEQDQLSGVMFPSLNAITDEGEHLLGANSFINYTMRTLLARGWLFYEADVWQLDIPAEKGIWQDRALVILNWLIDNQRLQVESNKAVSRQDFVNFDAAKNGIAVGRCGFLRREVQKHRYQLAFNSAYFLLEHDDFLSHHSALGEAYNLHVAGGEILRPPLYGRSAIWRDADAQWHVDRIGMQDIKLCLGDDQVLSHETDFLVNPELSSPIAIYTRYFGVEHEGHVLAYTPRSEHRIEFTIIDKQIVGWQRGGHLVIPQNGFILSFAPSHLSEHQLAQILASPDISYRLAGKFEAIQEAIQCGPRLLDDGTVCLEDKIFTEESFWISRDIAGQPMVGVVPTDYPIDIDTVRAGRVGIGIKANGDLVVVAVSGVNSGYDFNNTDSMGATLMELAYYLQQAGAVDATNLDGGGSTQLFYEGGVLTRAGDRRGAKAVVYERMIPSAGVVKLIL